MIPEIGVVGISHKSAPVEVREKYSLDVEGRLAFMDRCREAGIEEVVYISTCNRVEVYFAATVPGRAFKYIQDALYEIYRPEAEPEPGYFYKMRSEEAVGHLFAVASSLDSMVVGENEISGQVKDSYRESVAAEFTGVILNRLFHQAFSTAKSVRTETGISKSPVSVAFIASELASSIFSGLEGRSVLLIGAGEMGELILKYMDKAGVSSITIANRSPANAQRITEEINRETRVIPLEDIALAIPETDIIISSVNMKDYLLTASHLSGFFEAKGDKPLFIIDIGVPRNVDPAVAGIKNVYLYNIDDMKKIADENLRARKAEAESAGSIITRDAELFMDWYCELEIVPMITRINETFEQVRGAELQRFRKKMMKHFSKDDFALVEELTESILHKTLHNPIMAIKKYRATRTTGYHDSDSIREKTKIIRELFEKC